MVSFLSVAPSLIAFVSLLIVARMRRSVMPVVPGLQCAAALAPVIGTFFAVRAIVAALQAMSMSGGGIAAVSAGLWEATSPLIWASAFACVLALIALVVSVFGARGDAPRRPLVPMLISILAAASIVISAVQYRNIGRMLVEVLDPSAPPPQSLASVSQNISSGLLTAAVVSAVLALLLLAGVIVSAVTDRRAGRMLAFFALLVLLASAMSFNLHRGWAARFHHTAMTGEVQH